jgi:hypothetical protein
MISEKNHIFCRFIEATKQKKLSNKIYLHVIASFSNFLLQFVKNNNVPVVKKNNFIKNVLFLKGLTRFACCCSYYIASERGSNEWSLVS